VFNDNTEDHGIKFMRYMPPEQYLSILKSSKCLVGNSSAGIKECSYLGIPVVNIGSRQNSRLRAGNVIDVKEDDKDLKEIIKKQITKKYKSSHIYQKVNTSKKIADKLATIPLYIQKTFYE
jgi:UDP-N-acetylglucosamine 2-epimerase